MRNRRGDAAADDRSPQRPAFGSAFERWVERHLRVLMLAPAMLVLLALTIFPSIYMFVAALTRISPNPDLPWSFAGADNFLRLLTDEQFHVGLCEYADLHDFRG